MLHAGLAGFPAEAGAAVWGLHGRRGVHDGAASNLQTDLHPESRGWLPGRGAGSPILHNQLSHYGLRVGRQSIDASINRQGTIAAAPIRKAHKGLGVPSEAQGKHANDPLPAAISGRVMHAGDCAPANPPYLLQARHRRSRRRLLIIMLQVDVGKLPVPEP